MEAEKSNKGGGQCDLQHCSKRALYKCPRCEIFYCSVKCYQTHSSTCVQAFENDASQCLRGLKPAPEHRRRFNDLLERLRNDDGYHFPQDLAEGTEQFPASQPDCDINNHGTDECHDGDDGDDGDDVGDDEDSDHGGDEEDSDDNGEAAELLTRLMDQLPESGKDALFTTLHKAMESQTNTESNSQIKATQPPQSSEEQSQQTKQPPHPYTNARETPPQNDDEEEDEEILEVLEQVVQEMEETDLTYEQLASRLPPTLLRDFETRLQKGHTQDLVKAWTPWWAPQTKPQPNPQPPSTIPDLPDPTDHTIPIQTARTKASPLLIYNATEVIITYCHGLRRMNGDWSVDVLAMADLMHALSSVLLSDGRYDNADELAAVSFQRMSESIGAEASLLAIEDASALLGGSADWFVRGLNDCRGVFDAAFLAARQEDVHDGFRKKRKRFVGCARKIAFFVAWAVGESSYSFQLVADRLAVFVDDRSQDEVSLAKRAVRSLALVESGTNLGTAALIR